MDEKELLRKTKGILADYTEAKDEKEAVEGMKELQLEDSEIVKVCMYRTVHAADRICLLNLVYPFAPLHTHTTIYFCRW